jgi:hypothetical protein
VSKVFGPGHKSLAYKRLSIIIETKAHRGDHLKDAVREGLPLIPSSRTGKYTNMDVMELATAYFVAAPAGVVKVSEIPPGWGILSYDPETGALRKTHSPTPKTPADPNRLSSAIAETWTRNALFAELRDAHKALRAALPKRAKPQRVTCGKCASYTGPRRRSKDVRAPLGECSSPDTIAKLSGFNIRVDRIHPRHTPLCSGLHFKPYTTKKEKPCPT